MRITKKGIAAFILATALPVSVFAADAELQKKIDDLSQQLDSLKQQVQKSEEKAKATEEKVEKTEALAKQTDEKSLGKWLSIGGDYRFRVDSLTGNVPNYYQFGVNNSGMPTPTAVSGFRTYNDTLYTNRFGLNLKAKATENVSVKARLLMYKVSGAQNDSAVTGPYFGDRGGIFDGTLGHIPSDGQLTVDSVYATWSNIAEQPVWFSVGRRPSTGGSPTHLKNNTEKSGTAGTPALLVDYAFDGMTVGYAPDIDVLGSPFLKVCYGRGFDSGYSVNGYKSNNSLRDTDMLGVQVVPYNTDTITAMLQWNHAYNIFNAPQFVTGNSMITGPTTNLGSIDWIGADVVGKVDSVNWFFDAAMSFARPNNNTAFMNTGMGPYVEGMPIGLMYSGQRTGKNGWAIYLGGRYDLESTGTKFGFEYNHGSNDWITFAPAADDIWTSKLGTRGDVIEPYIIQEIKLKPISSLASKVFFKVGYQYYWFNATGSNNWVGGSVNFDSLSNPNNMQMYAPVKTAQDIYGTFEVQF
jgi:Protein of unknown function (DUF3373)